MPELLKGIGFIPGTDSRDIGRLNGSWYYNWWHAPQIGAGDTTFIPMIWSHRQVNDEVFEDIRRQNPPALLTWNEPSLVTQAGLPRLDSPGNVEEVMGYWRRIYEAFRGTGIPIASPAPASKPGDQRWARRFLREVKRRHMCPDVVALHYYCAADCAGRKAAEAFFDLLKQWRDWLDNTLGLRVPIWVTEYGCYGVGRDETQRFMENTFDIMLGQKTCEELRIERYCWFANRTFHPVFEHAALIDPQGALTGIGAIYQAVPPRHKA